MQKKKTKNRVPWSAATKDRDVQTASFIPCGGLHGSYHVISFSHFTLPTAGSPSPSFLTK